MNKRDYIKLEKAKRRFVYLFGETHFVAFSGTKAQLLELGVIREDMLPKTGEHESQGEAFGVYWKVRRSGRGFEIYRGWTDEARKAFAGVNRG